MNAQRNPFLFRASEHIEPDSTFVRFFSPAALDVLKDNNPLTARLLLSAPGAGKTSLMRLFTPGALLELYKHREVRDYQDLFKRMQGFGALSDEGPRILGILHSCSRGYASLADLGLEDRKQLRLFFSLLDTRILLAAVRQALLIKRLSVPGDLKRIVLSPADPEIELAGLSLPANGEQIYEWGRKREEEICSIIDSFEPNSLTIPGSDRLLSLDLLKCGSLKIDGESVAENILIMFDDTQQLTTLQREELTSYVLGTRSPTPVWIAQRLEALQTEQLLSVGNIQGRDYELVHLESFWREAAKRHENMLHTIADRRVQGSKAVQLYEFDPNLEDTLEGSEWDKHWSRAIETVSTRVKERAAKKPQFKAWIKAAESPLVNKREEAVAWRELEILIERHLRKRQLSFEFELAPSVLAEQSDSSLRTAADLFLANEFKVPFYYGPSVLAKLCSFNVQQYLGIAAPQFEEIISSALLNPHELAPLSAGRQEALLLRASTDFWAEIPRRASHGSEVKALLESIASYSRDYTSRPSAPNDPGVNGVAITMFDRKRLVDRNWLKMHPEHEILANAITSAVAQNLLEVQLNSRCKGQDWMILNLNRLLCVKYRLPLNYGKFKEQSLDTLAKWITKPYDSSKKDKEELL